MNIYFDETGKEHQKPGHIDSEWRISAYVCIQSDKRILMVQPTWNKNWELPGGGIEKEESIKEGIIRECYEETGYKIEVHDQPVSVGERNFFSKALGKFFKSVILIYAGNLIEKTPNQAMINTVEKNEIASVKWVRLEELNESNVHPIVWPTISEFIRR